MTPVEVARLIDHTLLKPEATRQDIETLCREALEYGFATVCVNPVWVALAAGLVQGSAVDVCTVVGVPLGATTADAKAFETRRAIADGAREVDGVIDIGALKSGMIDEVRRGIEAVTGSCREGGALSKIIVEAALLTGGEKEAACTMAKGAGADFVKTSTGFGPGGATAADVALFRGVVGPAMGIKAAGGIRGLAAVQAMLAAGATRIGTSAGVRIVREAG